MSKAKTTTIPTGDLTSASITVPIAQPALLKVKMAFLHQTITWPGKAGSEKSISATKILGLSMHLLPQGLMLEKGGSRCLVPLANIANMVLED